QQHWPDGIGPQDPVVCSESELYGTTMYGGISNCGTVFRVQSDGTGFTVLKNFMGSDGQVPAAGPVLSGQTLYGSTWGGGNSGSGTLFKINTDGSGYTVLKHFNGTDGDSPSTQLVLDDGALFGTTERGGAVSANGGTVFRLNADGSGYTVLRSFGWLDQGGSMPRGGLLLLGTTLYGTTYYGGSPGSWG